jgi:thiamine-phosphate pyrophosphorylase
MLRYAITDRGLFGGSLAAMLDHLVGLAADVDYIQVRERDLDAAALETFSRQLVGACARLQRGPQVLINHRADVAIGCGASGVHLRSFVGELTPLQVRELYAVLGLAAPTVSISCHTLEEVRRARDFGASIILFGPVYEKGSPANPGITGVGLEVLHHACEIAADVPVLALGGVPAERISACVDAGAAGVAAIRLFLQQ